jgi:heme exporter protein B
MSFWRKTWALIAKDLAVERRTREAVNVMFIFSLMVVVIFNFAFELRVDNVRQVAPGALWVAFAFAGVLGLNRSLAREREDGCLEGLLLAPLDRGAILVAKAAANLMLLAGVEIVILPIFTVLFGVNVLRLDLVLVLLLGSFGLAAVGTLLSAMVAQTRARDVLLPVLLLPVSVPLLIAAAKATAGLLDGLGLGGVGAWLQLLAAFDVVFAAVSYVLFEYVLEE